MVLKNQIAVHAQHGVSDDLDASISSVSEFPYEIITYNYIFRGGI